MTILWLNALKTALNFVTGAIASFRCLPARSGPKAQGHMLVVEAKRKDLAGKDLCILLVQ